MDLTKILNVPQADDSTKVEIEKMRGMLHDYCKILIEYIDESNARLDVLKERVDQNSEDLQTLTRLMRHK